MKKKFRGLGRTKAVAVLAVLLVVGGASAAILDSFGVIELTGDNEVDIDQAVLVEGDTLSDGDSAAVFDSLDLSAGESSVGSVSIENQAGAPVPIDFVTSDSGDQFDSANSQGYVYGYATIPIEERNDGTAQATGITDVDTDTDNVENGLVSEASIVLDTLVESTQDQAGITYPLDPISIEGGDEQIEVESDVLVGENDSQGATGEVGSVDATATVEITVQGADVTDEGTTYNTVTLVHEDVALNEAETLDLSEGYSDITADGESISPGAPIDYPNGAEVTDATVLTSSDGDTRHIIYRELTVGGQNAFEELSIEVDADLTDDSIESQRIVLQPEQEYEFGAMLDTSVYLDSSAITAMDIETELQVPLQ